MQIENNQVVAIFFDEYEQKLFRVFNNILFLAMENVAIEKSCALHRAVARNKNIEFSEKYKD